MPLLVLIILGPIAPIYTAMAQLDEGYLAGTPTKEPRRVKSIYVEALGSSGLNYSLNYDMRFKPGHRGWGFRVGVTRPEQVGQTAVYSFPVMVNRVESNSRVSLDAGAGFVVAYKRRTFEDPNNIIQVRQSVQFPAVANVGVRFQPLRTGIVWRVYWAPSWEIGRSSNFYPYWFGTSLGIGFH